MAQSPKLKVSLAEAKQQVSYCLNTGEDFSYQHMSGPALIQSEQWFERWTQSVKETLEGIFTTREVAERFIAATFPPVDMGLSEDGNRYYNLAKSVEKKIAWLKSLRESLETYTATVETKPDTLEVIRLLCSRFHTVARQLRQRHKRRATLDIGDEYDVQDLLHALLRIYFEDIREEEHTPSYAGGASRTDFLLKTEQVIIEVKKTRPTLKANELGEQLVIDIARYQAHPDCKMLYCFVYDPDGYIKNPQGIENDLNRSGEPFPVQVFIAPKLH